MIRFSAPAEVKGVVLLVVNHPDRSSDQWMWTFGDWARPAHCDAGPVDALLRHRLHLRRPGQRDANQYKYKLTGKEAIDGAACWRIEARPREGKTSQCTLTRTWIRKDNHMPVQYENLTRA